MRQSPLNVRFPPVEVPWTPEYGRRHHDFLCAILDDPDFLAKFGQSDRLPKGYGVSLDERVVEYPWALARCSRGRTLDAGSTLNHAHVLDRFLPVVEPLSIVTRAPEAVAYPERGIAYTYADLRELPFEDRAFDSVVSISTLEHVGMDNAGYGVLDPLSQDPTGETVRAAQELVRVLVPGGHLLVTVPYGERENHGWFRQFDQLDVELLISAIAPASCEVTIYAYDASGWQLSSLGAASHARYRDYTQTPTPARDRAAAARAIACLDMRIGGVAVNP